MQWFTAKFPEQHVIGMAAAASTALFVCSALEGLLPIIADVEVDTCSTGKVYKHSFL
jgi:hypothetical protein